MSRALLALGVLAWIPIAAGAGSPGGARTLDARTTLAATNDAVVWFRSATPSQTTLAVGQPSPESLPRSSGLMAIEYQTKRLEIAEIEHRLQEHGIRVRLDDPLDGATACVIEEVLRDLLAERGFADAAVGLRTTVRPGTKVKKVTFTIDEGKRSRPRERSEVSPAARCDR